MPSTFQGLAVILVALLPGALVIFSLERVAGRAAIGVGDRFLRFIGVSAFLYTLLAPVTYLIWHDYFRSGALGPDEKLPLWLWPIAVAYVLVPLALGYGVGRAIRGGRRWARVLTPDPPTAWDAVFGGRPRGWVLMRLKSGRWIGGLYHDHSYAGATLSQRTSFLKWRPWSTKTPRTLR
jgi:Family of unknown function (DUF6338)